MKVLNCQVKKLTKNAIYLEIKPKYSTIGIY